MASFTNKAKVLAILQRLPPQIKEAVDTEMRSQVDGLVAAIKRAAPVLEDEHEDREPGALRDSVRVEPDPKRPVLSFLVKAGGPRTTVAIRSGVRTRDVGLGHGVYDYARGVEFGHGLHGGGFVPAHPFFFSTYRARKRAMRRAIGAALKRRVMAIALGLAT